MISKADFHNFKEIVKFYGLDPAKCNITDTLWCGKNEHVTFTHEGDEWHLTQPLFGNRHKSEIIARKNGKEIFLELETYL